MLDEFQLLHWPRDQIPITAACIGGIAGVAFRQPLQDDLATTQLQDAVMRELSAL
ncbi:hypothetical protein [Chromohalobacter japonicus]|uniref:hypothetical protein n=1 Tax=Chromohalobacter japonicus TaxID=223900 RepID=UPI001C54F045